MIAVLKLRLEHVAEDAQAVADQVQEEVNRLKAATEGALKRLREARKNIDSIAAALLESRQAEAIMREVCQEFDVTETQIMGRCRTNRLVWPRHTFLWLLRRAGWSLQAAADTLKRDHGAVMNSLAVMETRRETDPQFRAKTDVLAAALGIE